ncbi:HNH endonuclease [Pseudomonas abietaniphila]|uniref:HNH endonuclease n=1 Tax=Pseudomonas abietaniphila TaxID=89065 RepID=UPI000784D8F2|nr:HNH endonuclease [Pseudomonas abietaniphila]
MFKVDRPLEAPQCTKKTGYNTVEIVEILHEIFQGKCYLCEKDNLHDPEIEHFVPHEKDDELKYDWQNLFYACGRCNSIKGATHTNLLNCTADVDISKKIQHFIPSSPFLPATIIPTDPTDQQSINTANLLDKCFNLKNTPLRAITRASLLEDLYRDFLHWLELRTVIVDKKSTEEETLKAVEKLKKMLQANYPFSVFWYWHTITDEKLYKKTKGYIYI